MVTNATFERIYLSSVMFLAAKTSGPLADILVKSVTGVGVFLRLYDTVVLTQVEMYNSTLRFLEANNIIMLTNSTMYNISGDFIHVSYSLW